MGVKIRTDHEGATRLGQPGRELAGHGARPEATRAGAAESAATDVPSHIVGGYPLAESAYPGQGVDVRRLGNPPLLARMATHRLVLSAVAVTVLIAAALAAALADFAGQGLSQAARRNLAAASGTSVIVSGTTTGNGAASATTTVRSAMRSAFGTVPVAVYGANWSDALDLPSPLHPKTVPQLQAAAMGGLRAHAQLIRGALAGTGAGWASPSRVCCPRGSQRCCT